MRGLVIAAVIAAAATGARPAPLQPVRVEVTDVVIGLDGRGPYALSWTRIAPASESVEVSGAPLLRGIDYTIDWAKGTITFDRPLASRNVARVSYLRQPGQSQPNQQSLDIPAAIPLAGDGTNRLALALRFQQQPSKDPYGVYGIRAGHEGATRIDAAWLFSQQVAGSDQRGANGARQGAGWRVGAQRRYSQLDLAASLARTDPGFTGAKDLGAPAGKETLQLAAAYRPTGAVTASAAATATDDLAAATTTHSQEYGLAVKAAPGADLALSRTEIETQRAAGATAQTTDKVQASLALGDATRAAASYQTSDGASGRAQEQSLRVTSKLGERLDVAAAHSEKASPSAEQRASDLAVAAGFSQARLRLSAGARRGAHDEDYHGLEARFKPASTVTVDAAYKERDYGDRDLASRSAAVALTPSGAFEIAGEYAHNPEDRAGKVREATATRARVSTRLGVIGLTGSVAREVAAAGDESRAGEVRLSLALARAHTLYTGYRQTQMVSLGAAAGETEVYTLGYERSVGRDFSLALEGQMERTRDAQLRAETRERADARLNWRF